MKVHGAGEVGKPLEHFVQWSGHLFEFRVSGFGFRVSGLGFRVLAAAFSIV